MKKSLITMLAIAAMVVLSRPAMADTVCASGVCYSLSGFTQDGSDGANTYDITMTVDFTNVASSGTLSSFAVQFNGASGVSWEDMGGTTGWTSSNGAGTFQNGQNTGQGCNSSSSGFWCTTGGNATFSAAGDQIYTFVFDVTFPEGTSLPDASHIQAFQGTGLAISCDVGIGDNSVPPGESNCTGGSQVPEPGSLMLFGTGLLGMAGFIRRKLMS